MRTTLPIVMLILLFCSGCAATQVSAPAEIAGVDAISIIRNFKVGEKPTTSLEQYPKPKVSASKNGRFTKYTWRSGFRQKDSLIIAMDQNGVVRFISCVFMDRKLGQEFADIITETYAHSPETAGKDSQLSWSWDLEEVEATVSQMENNRTYVSIRTKTKLDNWFFLHK